MKEMPILLDYVVFEIRYGSGYLFFDRCGQCLLDIERECPGWIATMVNLQTGALENPNKSIVANFNNQFFSSTAQKAGKLADGEFAKEISSLWNIIQANLGLVEFIRMACRLNFLLATQTIDEADKRLRQSKINLTIPGSLLNDGYTDKQRQVVVVLGKDGVEYRVELAAVTRYEGLAPPEILKTDPRFLSKKQNEFRIAKLKQISEYSANPMFAANLNVDCVRFNPETVSVEEFILKQTEVVEKTFLPFL